MRDARTTIDFLVPPAHSSEEFWTSRAEVHTRMDEMTTNLKALARRAVRKAGFDVVRHPSRGPIPVPIGSPTADAFSRDVFEQVAPFTMTSERRVHALVRAVEYVVRSDVPGSLIECGVWRGGSSMAVALTLSALGVRDRDLFLFDTFEGMTLPTERDTRFDGVPAAALLEGDHAEVYRCCADLDEVEENLAACEFPRERLHFVKGPVEETIPEHAPDLIALARLDTDWFESTMHELEHVYPRLANGAVLIIDDYGCWQGARQACDTFFGEMAQPPLLTAVDEDAVVAVVLK